MKELKDNRTKRIQVLGGFGMRTPKVKPSAMVYDRKKVGK